MMHLRFPNKNFQERRLLEAQKDQASLAAEDNEAFAAAQEGLQRQRQEQLGRSSSERWFLWENHLPHRIHVWYIC